MESDSDGTRGVIVPYRNGCPVVAAWGTPIHLCPSTLGKDPEGVKRRFNAMGGSTLQMDRDGTLLIQVADVFAYARETLDEETGEMSRHNWLVLIDPAGETWGTSSPVVAEKVGQLLALRHAGLIEWPATVQVVTRGAIRSGRRYHDLVMV